MDESDQTPTHGPADPDRGRQTDRAAAGGHLQPVRDDHHEVEDDGPEPQLDADLEAQVRALLAAAPDPGPMPERVGARISAALADEARLRVDRGPLTQAEHDDAILVPLIRQRQRPRPLFAAAAVAAAAAVVAVGGSALHLNKRAPGGEALLGDATTTVTTPTPPPVTATASPTVTPPAGTPTTPANPNLHIQLSHTRYTEDDLAGQARAMVSRPDAPIQVLAAEAPTLGPIATEIGLTSCLRELGLPTDVPVHVDLARYEGDPAAVIAVTQGGATTVRVVQRSCTTGHADVVKDAVSVP